MKDVMEESCRYLQEKLSDNGPMSAKPCPRRGWAQGLCLLHEKEGQGGCRGNAAREVTKGANYIQFQS